MRKDWTVDRGSVAVIDRKRRGKRKKVPERQQIGTLASFYVFVV